LNSATAALELALHLLGIGLGDEVITCAYTYTASCSAIIHVGATPILVDVAPDSFHLDYDQIAQKITVNTKAIVSVDIGGVMCDYDRLFSVLEEKKNLFKPSSKTQEVFDRVIVIGDAAHALGATYKGQIAGSVADFTAFSLVVLKNRTSDRYTGIRSGGSKAA